MENMETDRAAVLVAAEHAGTVKPLPAAAAELAEQAATYRPAMTGTVTAVVAGARRLRDRLDIIERAAARRARGEGATVRELAAVAGLTERAAVDRYRLPAVRVTITRPGQDDPALKLDLGARGALVELERWLAAAAAPGPVTVTAVLPDDARYPMQVDDLAVAGAVARVRTFALIWQVADPDLDRHIADRGALEQLRSYYLRSDAEAGQDHGAAWVTTLPPATS